MDIPSSNELIDRLMIEVPLFLLAMFIGGLCVFLTSDPAWTWTHVTWTWTHILSFGAQLMHILIQLWTYSAPILWLLLFGGTMWQGYQEPLPDERGRGERRAESQFKSRHSHKRCKYASIADTQFHRSYPRRLREQSRYHRRPPRVMERTMYQQQDHLHTAALQVLETIHTHGRNPLRPGREGVNSRRERNGNCQVGRSGTNHVGCRVAPRQRCRRPRARSSHHQKHRPASSASPKHGFGNGHWTQHQEAAARKIATQVNMVCFDV